MILGIFGLYKYLSHPDMTIIVKYKEVPPVIRRFPKTNINAFYRGYKVGYCSKINLSDDQKYIVFYLGIHYKNLKLPKNTKIYLNTEDLYGSMHFSLDYPDNPSSKLLSNGDVIYGTGAYDRIDKYLIKDIEEGKLGQIISNMVVITDFLKKEAINNNGEFNNFLKSIEISRNDFGLFINELRQIINDPALKQGIKFSSRTLNNVNQILETRELRETITKAPKSIDKTIKNLEAINKNTPEITKNLTLTNHNFLETNETVNKTNSLLSTTNCNLETINCKVPVIPSGLLEKVDCLSNELIEMLNKRFLIFRFMFGKPGSSFKNCKQNNCKCLKSKEF
ncbi:MAG: hypothetical protein A2039_04490 [Candidatus Melainabacteria bacterium GWA2_34_9]|nr:MAG: hypothetical protein A2039_04490 [Candidatus Melainabacteria bacterium GWA2_34_9]